MAEDEAARFVIDALAETYRKRHAATQEPTANAARLIEGWYNPRRRHSALDYLSPMAYEKKELSRV